MVDSTPPPSSRPAGRTGSHDASQTARAFVSLREWLLRGELTRGSRVSEVRCGERLEMSRTPIRMALERLAHLGLLDVSPAGGFVVREFSIDEVRDAIELRAVLEGTAARLAAERLVSQDELERICHYRDEVKALTELSLDENSVNSFARYMDVNESLHAAVVSLSKSVMLSRLLEQVHCLPFASPSAMVFPTSMFDPSARTLAMAQQQHDAIVDAIRRRQGTRAEHLAREHARLASRVLDLALAEGDGLNHVPGGALINVDAR